jgi:ATP-dependent protease ClpP protease subunit
MKFDTFLSAEEAVKWGLADQVLDKRELKWHLKPKVKLTKAGAMK